MTEIAPHTGHALLEVNQAQKELTANGAFLTLDALLNTGAISMDFTAPPVSPANGDVYIIPVSSGENWNHHDHAIAWYHGNVGWSFITPNEGMTLWINDKNILYSFDGSSWAPSVDRSSTPSLGINTTADTTNRLSATTQAVLFNAETDDIQVKLNKMAVGDTASFLFQTGFSGRAEIGLTSNDDFSFKVSPDGSTFYNAITIDKDNGHVGIGNGEADDGYELLVKNNGTSNAYIGLQAGDAGVNSIASFGHASAASGESSQILFDVESGNSVALIDFTPKPGDGTSNASVRFFRSTNTSGGRTFDIHLGDGSGGVNARFSGGGDCYVNSDTGNFGVGTSAPVDKLSVSGNAVPQTDNAYSLGKSSYRWSAIWSANGTIQTSDKRDKTDIESIGDMATFLVRHVEAKLFRWKTGGYRVLDYPAYAGQDPHNADEIEAGKKEAESGHEARPVKPVYLHESEGKRHHAGFIAQDIKAAMDDLGTDFGAWGIEQLNDPDSKQFIRPDQLIPVLWQTCRQLLTDVEEVKQRIRTYEAH